MTPLRDPIKNIVYNATDEDVDRVYVNGRLVVDGGRVLAADERAILAALQAAGDRMWPRMAKSDWAGRSADQLSPADLPGLERLGRGRWADTSSAGSGKPSRSSSASRCWPSRSCTWCRATRCASSRGPTRPSRWSSASASSSGWTGRSTSSTGRSCSRALRGDLGRSLRSRAPVADEILARFPATLELTTASMIIAVLVGVPLGLIAAVRRATWVDYLAMTTSLSTPLHARVLAGDRGDLALQPAARLAARLGPRGAALAVGRPPPHRAARRHAGHHVHRDHEPAHALRACSTCWAAST